MSALRLSLSRGYAGLGDVAEAARLAEEVLRVRVQADGALARTTLPARVSLAEHVGRLGELPRSIAQFDTAIRIQQMGSDVAPREVAVLLQARARALFAAGALDAAERGEREVIALFDAIGDRATVPYAHAWQVLGQIQHRRGQLAAADSSLRTSLAVREDMRGNPVEIANVEGDLGKVQLARGDHAAAMTLLTRSRARKVAALGAQD
nr:hypothetical protein [Gemmatimonadaceae bacterium]